MKFAPYIIAGVFLLGGTAGILNPREWTYVAGNKYGGGSHIRKISKENPRYLSGAAVALGGAIITITLRFSGSRVAGQEQASITPAPPSL